MSTIWKCVVSGVRYCKLAMDKLKLLTAGGIDPTAHCEEEITQYPKLDCGHDNQYKDNGECKKPCGATLLCGDTCEGDCSACHQGRMHLPCKKPCGKPMICGHVCDVPCKASCQPCSKPCNVKCSHKQCDLICGAPCEPCMEPCEWTCKHLKCSKLCWEPCDRELCDQPCDITLECCHTCVGVCGEPCPPCRTCQPEMFVPIFLVDEEEAPSARFYKLLPCKHLVEVSSLQIWFTIDPEKEITSKRCPRCCSVIENCEKFKELRYLRTSINEIKSKEFGSLEEVKKLKKDLFDMINQYPYFQIPENTKRLKTDSAEGVLVVSLCDIFKTDMNNYKGVLSKQNLLFLKFKFETLKKFINTVESYWKYLDHKSRQELKVRHQFLLKNICTIENLQKNQYEDLKSEINRTIHFGEIAYISSTEVYLANRNKQQITNLFDKITNSINCLQRYCDNLYNECETQLQLLRNEIHLASTVTAEERMMINEAMSSSFHKESSALGHWYKCTGGHIYCITECGSAREASKCPECQESIGGENYRYVKTIRTAPEMNAAKYPKWYHQYKMRQNPEMNAAKHPEWYPQNYMKQEPEMNAAKHPEWNPQNYMKQDPEMNVAKHPTWHTHYFMQQAPEMNTAKHPTWHTHDFMQQNPEMNATKHPEWYPQNYMKQDPEKNASKHSEGYFQYYLQQALKMNAAKHPEWPPQYDMYNSDLDDL